MMEPAAGHEGRRIRVRGTVQGVGFRPTVWHLARQCGLTGRVCNDGEGVLIDVFGTASRLDDFERRVRCEAPPLARIDALDVAALGEGEAPAEFRIEASRNGAVHTAVVPDAATCAACLAEIGAPGNRRHGHAFANCTHCGPRLSILRSMPYDRAHTTMAGFAMCAACRAEYENPADRRFHAQPTACPSCGPRLWLEDAAGTRLLDDPAHALTATRSALLGGHIVAIKGLGGFHLACDALDDDAVTRLRTRKRRADKPLALMARSVDVIRRFCAMDSGAAAWLRDSIAPIVLLPASGLERVAPQVAPGIASLGFMLPHTPLHHLLFEGLERPIVFTSGNLSDEPPCTGNDEARQRLGTVADLFLMHDRDIAVRIDDSVVRIIDGAARVLRRARGFAPAPMRLPAGFEHAPPLLAMGGELKNTFCFIKEGAAILSQHIGDLEAASAHADYVHSLALFSAMFEHRPRVIAVDGHPEYLSSKLGRERAASEGLVLEDVQHHHAHVASCLAENGRPLAAPPVLGIALDGLGYGADGTFWGGEFLLADYRGFIRLACFKPIAMIGGAQAVREPWRSSYSHVRAAFGWPAFEARYAALDLHDHLRSKPLALLDSMLAARINCPPASSCGRLFDAVAAALGICRERAGYEGQAAIELEAIANGAALVAADPGYPFATAEAAGLLPHLDPAPMWQALFDDLLAEVPVDIVALRFHRGLAQAVVQLATTLAEDRSRSGRRFDTVALTGGVFQNVILNEAVHAGLVDAGFAVLAHSRVPSHDGGLSLGQAVVAAARSLRRAAVPEGELACA